MYPAFRCVGWGGVFALQWRRVGMRDIVVV